MTFKKPTEITLEELGKETKSSAAYGDTDFMKVQSQHERLIKEIKHLPEEKQIKELNNAVNFIFRHKSDYWIE